MNDITTAAPSAAPSSAPERLSQGAFDALAPAEKLGYARQFSQPDPALDSARAPAPQPGERPAASEAPKTDAGKFRFGQIELSEQEIGDLVAFKAQADSRRLSAPETPEAYQTKTSPNFKPPPGIEFVLNANDPLWPQAKAWAHRNGISQEAFEQAVDLVAGRDLISHQQIQTAVNREIEKLGPTAAARVDAIETFYKALLGDVGGKAMMARIFNAGDVALHEKLVRRFSTQGHASFSAAHREPGEAPGRVSDADYARMKTGEKFSHARQFDQAQFKR